MDGWILYLDQFVKINSTGYTNKMFLIRILKKLRIFRKPSLTKQQHKIINDKSRNLIDTSDRSEDEKYFIISGKLDESYATTSQTSLKDLIAIAEMEIKNEKHLLASDIDSCYNSGTEDEDIEDLYEEMNFNSNNQSDLYMSMVFRK